MPTKKTETKGCQINVRLSPKDLKLLDRKMTKADIESRSQYVRMLIRRACRPR